MNILVIFIIFSINNAKGIEFGIKWENYCNQNENHILCLYDKEHHKSCDNKGLIITEIQSPRTIFNILHAFNDLRLGIAENFEDEEGKSNIDLGTSSRMQEFKWDPFLAKLAFTRCKICDFTSLTNPEDVKLKTFTPGEMIASPNHPKTPVDKKNWSNNRSLKFVVAFIWNLKINKFDTELDYANGRLPYSEYIKINPNGNEILHSTFQMMKDDHYLVGCAKSTYKENKEEIRFYVCFTGISTAQKTMNLTLKKGDPASDCINEKSLKYPSGLCSSFDEKEFPLICDEEDECLKITTNIPSTPKPSLKPGPPRPRPPSRPRNDPTKRPKVTFDFDDDDDPSGGEESENAGSKSSRNRCYWSFIFSCFAITVYMQ